MNRLTVVVEGPLAFHMRRWGAVARRETGVQIYTLPMLAARLAGGFYRAVGPEELQPAIACALTQGCERPCNSDQLSGVMEIQN
jgi:hypothetical protein